MDQKVELLHDNPLFSPSEASQEKCSEEDPKKRTPKANSPEQASKNGSEIEELPTALNSSRKMTPKASPGKMKAESSGGTKAAGRNIHHRKRSMTDPIDRKVFQYDEDALQDMADLRKKFRKFMEEEKDYERENPYSPLIIQAGGVASYHPIYSPFAPRPRFLGYRCAKSAGDQNAENASNKRRPRRHRSTVEENVATTEVSDSGYSSGPSESARGSKVDQVGHEINGAAHAAIPDTVVCTKNDPESAENADLDSTAEPSIEKRPKSVETDQNFMGIKSTACICRFRNSSVIWAVMFILILSFALAAANSGLLLNSFGTDDNSNRSEALYDNIPFLKSGLSRLRDLKEYIYWFRKQVQMPIQWKLYVEGASLRRLMQLSYSHNSVFSLFKSCGGCMGDNLYRNLKNFGCRFIDNFKNFLFDLLRTLRKLATGLAGLCKCFGSTRVMTNKASEEDIWEWDWAFYEYDMDLLSCQVLLPNCQLYEDLIDFKEPRRPNLRKSKEITENFDMGMVELNSQTAPSRHLDYSQHSNKLLLSAILGMDICPIEENEGGINICSIFDDQFRASSVLQNSFSNVNETVVTASATPDSDDTDQEDQPSHGYCNAMQQKQEGVNADNADYHNGTRISADKENILTAMNNISERLEDFSFPFTAFLTQADLNGESEDPIEVKDFNATTEAPLELNHEYLDKTAVKILALLVSVIIIFVSGIKIYFPQFLPSTIEENLARTGGHATTPIIEAPKMINSFHEKQIIEATSPALGSYIDYMNLVVSSEGSRGKERKSTPVRRSVRIRNKSLSPLSIPPIMFTSPK